LSCRSPWSPAFSVASRGRGSRGTRFTVVSTPESDVAAAERELMDALFGERGEPILQRC
jgi:hypothetical protein